MDLVSISNSSGISIKILTYGGIIKEINTPDRYGNFKNIVLSYQNKSDYLNDKFFIGALIGRYCNRISQGKFKLNNQTIILEKNEGNNHLHGGVNGFHKKIWKIVDYDNENKKFVKLSLDSKDLESGYPGNLHIEVKYSITDENQFLIEFFAKSDKDTLFNPSSHSYFNLNPSNNSILKHKLKINSIKHIPLNSNYIPTGKLNDSKHTPFDFSSKKEIGKEIDINNEQLKIGNGYDHCFVLNRDNDMEIAAELSDEVYGRKVTITTDQPGIQLYSGNHLKGKFKKNEGVCLETQHFPDSPNNKNFPTTVLKANEEYYTKTTYHFGII